MCVVRGGGEGAGALCGGQALNGVGPRLLKRGGGGRGSPGGGGGSPQGSLGASLTCPHLPPAPAPLQASLGPAATSFMQRHLPLYDLPGRVREQLEAAGVTDGRRCVCVWGVKGGRGGGSGLHRGAQVGRGGREHARMTCGVGWKRCACEVANPEGCVWAGRRGGRQRGVCGQGGGAGICLHGECPLEEA